MQQDAMQIKEKIISILRLSGPSLPVHIAKGTGLSILFASAFLSELFYEKKIIISNIKVGNSPLYFLSGQEPQLERFSQNLKSKEKEAFLLLKESGFLKDSEQEPAIRVALREIKDFAIAFRRSDEVYWRYFTVPEEEFNKKKEPILIEVKKELEIVPEEESTEELEESEETEEEPEEELKIFEPEEIVKKEKKKITKKKESHKKDEKFFNRIKEFLSEGNIEITDIQSFNKNDLVLKIKEDKEEKLLIAYNKKKITVADLLKAHKRAVEANLQYVVLSLGELSKNLKNIISAVKDLSKIEKVE
jgi:hypothetical protein